MSTQVWSHESRSGQMGRMGGALGNWRCNILAHAVRQVP